VILRLNPGFNGGLLSRLWQAPSPSPASAPVLQLEISEAAIAANLGEKEEMKETNSINNNQAVFDQISSDKKSSSEKSSTQISSNRISADQKSSKKNFRDEKASEEKSETSSNKTASSQVFSSQISFTKISMGQMVSSTEEEDEESLSCMEDYVWRWKENPPEDR
jgi:uncharacterized membrane protein YfhO